MNKKCTSNSNLVEVENVLYGEQTALTLSNMSFSGKCLSSFPIYIKSLAQVKKACALANFRSENLSCLKKDSILLACDQLICGSYMEQFPVDVFHGGGGIGINMNINEVIATLAGENVSPMDDINLCQSTSDVCHTSLRLALISLIDELLPVLSQIIATLNTNISRFAPVRTIARTCLQDGMEVSASAIFEGLQSALLRQEKALIQQRLDFHIINLGGTVIGSGTGATKSYREHIIPSLCEVTNLPLTLHNNLYDAAQYPDDICACSALIRRTAAILAKFAADLRLLSSGPETGFAELLLPAVQAGSTFFPGKINPVIPETMMQCSMLISAQDGLIQQTLAMGEMHLNLWEVMSGFLLMHNCSMLTNCAQLFDKLCLNGIEINTATCEVYAKSRIPELTRIKEQYGYEYVSKTMLKK